MDENTKIEVWNNARSFNNEYKLDQCGALVKYSDYGNEYSKYGWEIDHITPKSQGGKDIVSNFRILHCKNNASRQNGRLNTAAPLVKAFIKNKDNNTWDNAIKKEDNNYQWL